MEINRTENPSEVKIGSYTFVYSEAGFSRGYIGDLYSEKGRSLCSIYRDQFFVSSLEIGVDHELLSVIGEIQENL